MTRSNARIGGRTASLTHLKLLSAIAGIALPSAAMASVSFTGTTLSENFDGLQNSGSVAAAFDATAGIQAPIPGLTTWDAAKIGGTGSSGMNFVADNGTLNSGALYSYGATDSTERALGSLASGSNVPAFGVAITNDSAFAITSFTISFTAEQWRSSTTSQNSLAFAYGVSGTGSIDPTNYLTSGDMTAYSALNAVAQPAVASNGATDGNDPANQTAASATVAVNIPIGATLFIRWQDFNDFGNDAGIGIDDWSFSAIGGGKTLTWNPSNGGNTWNTTTTNWLDGATPSTFSTNDVVNFTDAAVGVSGGVVNIDAAGVSPGLVNVTNTSGTYTFNGGTISGSSVLTKTGSGTLVLNAPNTSTGGVDIQDGHVVVSSDAPLGGGAIAVTMGGGTLVVNGSTTLDRGLSLTASTNSALDIGGNTVTITGPIAGAGALNINSTGTLVLEGTVNATGTTNMGDGTLVLNQPPGSTVSFVGGGNFGANIVVNDAIRLNLNGIDSAGGSTYGGPGKIFVKGNGAVLSGSAHSVISKDIVLNPDNTPAFVTFVGGGGGNRITLNNPISGNSDVNWSLGPQGGGAATIELNAQNTYTGATLINNGGQTPASGTRDGFPAGSMVLGIDNALPPGSDLIANTITNPNNGPGRLDLNGHTQTFASMSTGAGAGTGLFEITNAGFSTGTIIVNGDNTPATAFNGIITDGPQDGTGASPTVLVKDGSGTLAIVGVYPDNYTYQLGGNAIPVRPYSGGAIIKGGTLLVANNSKNPILTGGGADLQHGRLVFDYNDGTDSTPDTVKSLLTTSHASGFATGQIHSTTADTAHGLGWKDDSANKLVTVAYTFYGDANLDGQVDVTDLGALATNWQTSNVWAGGDFNYDGFVDVTDLGALATNWQQGVGNPLGPGSLQAALASVGLGNISVPEPASLGVLGICLAAAASRRRRALPCAR